MCGPVRVFGILMEVQHGDDPGFGLIRENNRTFITESLNVSDQRTGEIRFVA
jgi:hypothetical protein